MIDVIPSAAPYMVQTGEQKFFNRVPNPPELGGSLERLSGYRFRKAFIGSDVCDAL